MLMADNRETALRYEPHDLELYQAAHDACCRVSDANLVLEIGTYLGSSAKDIMLASVNCRQGRRWLFTIDPYGSKPYAAGDSVHSEMDYHEAQYQTAMLELHEMAKDLNAHYVHWRMLSRDFMKVFESIEFWHERRRITEFKVAFAYLDGEHTTDIVRAELDWCWMRMPDGAGMAIDNVEHLGGQGGLDEMMRPYRVEIHLVDSSSELVRAYVVKL